LPFSGSALIQALVSKASQKRKHLHGLNELTVQNPTNQKIYTVLSGFIPMPNLKNHEIDVLKILCGDNSESLRNFLHFSDFRPFEGGHVEYSFKDYIASILPEFAQNLERYFSFLQVALSDRNTYDALEFYKEHVNDITSLFLNLPTADRKTRLTFFTTEIHKTEGASKSQVARVYPFSDFFHTEMLLLYAMGNNITVQDFNLGALKEQVPLEICSYNEMCPKCEGLFGQYLFHNPQRQFIVAYVNEQSSHKSRTFATEPPLGNFFKVHVPMPKTKAPKPPEARYCSITPNLLPSAAPLSMSADKFKFFESR
jgi:hypothetical protein